MPDPSAADRSTPVAPLAALVGLIQRQAPLCESCHLPMFISPGWFVCPACCRTEDFGEMVVDISALIGATA